MTAITMDMWHQRGAMHGGMVLAMATLTNNGSVLAYTPKRGAPICASAMKFDKTCVPVVDMDAHNWRISLERGPEV